MSAPGRRLAGTPGQSAVDTLRNWNAQPLEHGRENVRGSELLLSQRFARPERRLHVRPDQASMAGPMVRYLEPLAENKPLAGNHHQISRTISPEQVDQLDGCVRLGAVPASAEPFFLAGADRSTKEKDIPPPGCIVNPAVPFPDIGLATPAGHGDPAASVFTHEESNGGFLCQRCDQV
jgi:hypothetical protein